MFKLLKLRLHNIDDSETFDYDFTEGINYFIGKNDSGKTEFYTFIDFMFGLDLDLYKRDWFKDTLLYADLFVKSNDIVFVLTRYLNDENRNYFRYADEPSQDAIRLDEYKERINHIFAQDDDCLQELRSFVGEDISFRTFTLFNFLGENRQGVLNDFFDKCKDIRYSIKLPAILNYIFNKNLAEIEALKKKESELVPLLDSVERRISRNEDISNRINRQLEILGIDKVFKGNNSEEILQEIENLQKMVPSKGTSKKKRTIDELEAVYTSLDEQIKIQLKTEADCKSIEATAQKQKDLLDNLQSLISTTPSYSYLVEPIISLTTELEQSISFSKYVIQESTTKELKKRRDKIRNQIQTEQSKYRIYSAPEKTQAMTLVREYLNFYDANLSADYAKDIRSQIRDIRERIKYLQNSNDIQKIRALSDDITRLYKLSVEVSDLVNFDFEKAGFRIVYVKNGNTLQPQISENSDTESTEFKNYYTGSMARHTLIQLCGYLAFLRLLVKENRYPLIPIFVVDHVSKPFDVKNEKAIGEVLGGVFSDLTPSDLQIFMFDDKSPESLGIVADNVVNLVNANKSGFNPFYQKPKDEVSPDTEG